MKSNGELEPLENCSIEFELCIIGHHFRDGETEWEKKKQQTEIEANIKLETL